jgi:hypothetical protein
VSANSPPSIATAKNREGIKRRIRATTNDDDAFRDLLIEADNAVINEHFRCDCGHEWSRELDDGLIAIGCPVCGKQHMTSVGRLWAVVVSEPRK